MTPERATPRTRASATNWRPFPVQVLPESVCGFVKELATSLCVDVASVAVAALTVLAAAIGNARRVRLFDDWVEPSILWTLLVSESGNMKGPTLRPVVDPLWQEEDRLAREFDNKQRHHGAPGPRPSEQIGCERRIVMDATIEALAPILRASPRGLLLFSEEGAGWFNSFGEYKKGRGGDAARWCSLFDAARMTVDRRGGDSPTIRVASGSVSVLAAIQPGLLARCVGDEHRESGLLARCALVMPPALLWQMPKKGVAQSTRNRFAVLVQQLSQLPFDGREFVELALEPEVQTAFEEFANAHSIEAEFLSELEAARHSKARGLAARLGLIVGLARDPGATKISQLDIDAGVAIARWLEAESSRVCTLLFAGESARSLDRLAERIERRGGRVTVREYQNTGPRALRTSSEAARAALQVLVTAGRARWLREIHGGRPSDVLELIKLDSVHAPACDKSDRSSEHEDSAQVAADESPLLSPPAGERASSASVRNGTTKNRRRAGGTNLGGEA